MSFIQLLPLIVLAICFVIRIPIPFSIYISCIVYFIATGLDMGLVCSVAMGQLYSNTTLVAIPLFIFTANLMTSGKVTEYMYTFAKSIIGKRRGATAYMNIIVSLIFSGMTGSAAADACGTGIMEVDEMRRDGYDAPFSCALTCATATVGPIFPPSIPLVIYALMAEVSVGSLFAGGMIPALLICIALGVYCWLISKKRKYPYGIHFTFKQFLKYSWKAFPALLTPVILLGGMYTGVVTATEAGVLAAVWAIIVSILFYKSLNFQSFFKALKDTLIQSGLVLAAATGAWVFSYIVTSSGLGNEIANWFINITNNKYVFLLIFNVVFLFLGMLFENSILMWVFLPILIPVVSAMGIDMIHFGVIFVVNTMIGLCTPPYGGLVFMVGAITKVSIQKIFKEVTPMCLVMIIILLIMTYIPEIVMFIPNLLIG